MNTKTIKTILKQKFVFTNFKFNYEVEDGFKILVIYWENGPSKETVLKAIGKHDLVLLDRQIKYTKSVLNFFKKQLGSEFENENVKFLLESSLQGMDFRTSDVFGGGVA